MRKLFLKSLRVLIVALGLAVIAEQRGWAQPAPPVPFSKEGMLRDIARHVFGADWQEAASRLCDLTNTVSKLAATPGQDSLDDVRKAWLSAADVTDRLRCFQTGPIVDRDYASAFYYWQVLPARIEATLASNRPIDQALLDELGCTCKGLFAVEYLVFDRKGQPENAAEKPPTALQFLSGPDSQRRTAFLLAVARDLESKASQLANDWSVTGDTGPPAKFIKGGQDSVNLLVNQLARAIEEAAERRLNFVLMLPSPIAGQLNRIERSRSASSLQGLLACLEGTKRLYCGNDDLGLDDALKRLNAPLEKRVREKFDEAIATTAAIAEPLEQAAVNNRPALQRAYEQVHALEILIKVDLASALGVTLTFSSNDGD